MKGLFITFEGPEGSGKSTQIKLLRQFLADRGHDVVTTREPGGTVAGDRIRSVLLDKDCGSLEPETELFLMLAQRSEHLKKVILPALKTGKTVLCDRYFDSSMAYQGHARGLGIERVRNVHEAFLPGFLPDGSKPDPPGATWAPRCGGKHPARHPGLTGRPPICPVTSRYGSA